MLTMVNTMDGTLEFSSQKQIIVIFFVIFSLFKFINLAEIYLFDFENKFS